MKVVFPDFEPNNFHFEEDGKQYLIVPPGFREESEGDVFVWCYPEDEQTISPGAVYEIIEVKGQPTGEDSFIISDSPVPAYDGPKVPKMVLMSVDGITIAYEEEETTGYSLLDGAQKIVKFVNRCVGQRYYSSNEGRISLAAAIECCMENSVHLTTNQ